MRRSFKLGFVPFWVCACATQSPVMETVRVDWLVPAMGTVVRVSAVVPVTSQSPLRELAERVIHSCDLTFSDWSEESELRRLERNGLTNWQTPTPLFLDLLRISREAHEQTNGFFDPAVGAVIWKVSSLPSARFSDLEWGPKGSFRFARDPVRLTFGGIAKGYCLGLLADRFEDNKVDVYRIDGGGGNRVERGPNQRLALHVSGSRATDRGGAPHLIDPKNAARVIQGARMVSCRRVSRDESEAAVGARADVWSKALVLNPHLQLPLGCELHRP